MKRLGFTLMEVAVAAALIAILASATVPTFIDYIEMRNVETTAKALAAIGNGIVTYESIVHTAGGTTNVYPDSINYLTNQIGNLSLNSCGVAYGNTSTTLLSTFNSGFPYVSFYIPYGGYNTPVGTISGVITRTPATANLGTISINMNGIDSMDAARLERYIDGDDINNTTFQTSGSFRLFSFTGGSGTPKKANVGYVIPVAPKC